MQRALNRWIVIGASVLVAGGWIVGSGLSVSSTWALRSAMAKVEQAREEARCGFRPGADDNRQRCRDTVQLIYSSEGATAYLEDGLVVFGPAMLSIVAGAVWFRRGRPRKRLVRPDPPPPSERAGIAESG